jgi:hypothetical protein
MYRPTFLVIGEENDELNDMESKKIQLLKEGIHKNKHVFLFVFMNTCGPCIQTKPEWDSTKDMLEKKFGNRDDFMIARLNYKFFNELGNQAGNEPSGFPTLRYVKNKGAQEYEDSGFHDRSTDSFLKWMTSKIEKDGKSSKSRKSSNKSSNNSSKKSFKKSSKKSSKKTRKNSLSSLFQIGGKWSTKYKKSINCKKPKGFSQRQHCKYGRKNWKK